MMAANLYLSIATAYRNGKQFIDATAALMWLFSLARDLKLLGTGSTDMNTSSRGLCNAFGTVKFFMIFQTCINFLKC